MHYDTVYTNVNRFTTNRVIAASGVFSVCLAVSELSFSVFKSLLCLSYYSISDHIFYHENKNIAFYSYSID